MKTLKPKFHGIFADLTAATIFVFPFLLSLDSDRPKALSHSVAGNVSLIVYDLLINYSYNNFKFTPLNAHLILDSSAGFTFVTVPRRFG